MKGSNIFSRNNLIRGLLFAGVVLIISLFLPRSDKFSYQFSLGKPWSYALLTAPFDIPINLDSISIKLKTDSINLVADNIYRIDNSITRDELDDLSARLTVAGASTQLRYRIIGQVSHLYNSGIIDSETYAKIEKGNLPSVKILTGNTAAPQPTTYMVSPKRAYEKLDSILSDSLYQKIISKIKIAEFLVPNVVVDSLITNKMREEYLQKALAPIGVMQKGERIIDRGNVVTPQTYTLLKTYQSMMTERNMSSKGAYYPIVGQVLVIIILITILYIFLGMFRWKFFSDMRKMTFLMLMITIFTVCAFLVTENFRNGIYIIPFAAIPIIFTIFFDSRTALFIHIIEIFMCTLVTTFPLEFLFLQFVAGVAAIDSLQELSKRGQLIRCAILIFISYAITYTALDIIKEGNIEGINYHFYIYFLINTMLLSFTYIFIFVIEKMFGFISNVTLVELSDVNNSLLRELSEKCPGTFQHSLQVSNLAAEAARKINANVQLVRTGALYHDIGKINNPAFFTENQQGVNPHELLSPEQSAGIVINHVADGVKMADKAKLPQVIKDFITQHHGKGKAKYFYVIASNKSNGNVDEALYTYPGPTPQTKETSILMMADATEAASRSLKDFSDEAITQLVNKIIDTQVNEGMFKDSPLSFRDIELIKKTFIQRLRTIYHTRISYPDAK